MTTHIGFIAVDIIAIMQRLSMPRQKKRQLNSGTKSKSLKADRYAETVKTKQIARLIEKRGNPCGKALGMNGPVECGNQ